MARRYFRAITLILWLGIWCLALTPNITTAQNSSANISSRPMELNVKEMPVEEVLALIAEQGEFNLAIGSEVNGDVTLYVADVPANELLDLVLGMVEAAYVEENSTIWVMTTDDYEERYGEPYFENTVTEVFSLRHLRAEDVADDIQSLVGRDGEVVADEAQNSLLVIDTRATLRKVREYLAVLDHPEETRVFPVQYMPVLQLTEQVTGLLPEGTSVVGDPLGRKLVITAPSFEIQKLETLIPLLDVQPDLTVQTFTIQHARADTLKMSLEPFLTAEIGSIHADVRSQRLVVQDFPEVVAEIGDRIADFDVPRRQVLIEARIIMVALSNNIKSGIDWAVLQDRVNVTGTFPALGPTDPGLRGDFGDLTSKNYQVVVDALEEFGETKLLSSPRVVVSDGGTGYIHVGSQVPYKTVDSREATSGSVNRFEKVTVVDVGIRLQVTATLNGEDMVNLSVKPEVSSVTGYSENIPIVDTATAESNITIEDGNTAILGGLIKEEIRKVRKGIPLLMHIPLLKYVFSSTSDQTMRSEMAILLTPRIMSGREKVEERLLQYGAPKPPLEAESNDR